MPEALSKRLEEEQARRIAERFQAESRNRQSIPGRLFDQAAAGFRDVAQTAGVAGGVDVLGEKLGLPPLEAGEPGNVAEQAARTAGQTLPLAPVLGGAASLVGRSAVEGGRLLTRVLRGAKNVTAEIGQRFRASPSGFTAAETGLGGAAGVGGFYAKQAFPDSDAAQFIGEVAFGTAPSFTPINLARRGVGAARKHMTKFRRGMARAEKRIQRAVPTEGHKQRAIEQLDQPTTLDPETGRPVLSLAQRTEDQGLLSLERDIATSSGELTRAWDDQIVRANEVIQQSADMGGSPAEAQEYFRNLIDTRLRIAAQRSDERIAALGPNATREQANRVASEEVNNAVQAAAAQRRALFEAIPQDDLAPTAGGAAAIDALLGRGDPVTLPSGEVINKLPMSQVKDLPVEARRLLNRKSSAYLGKKNDETTVGELVGLKNTLAETSRKARAAGDLNKARVADRISEAIEQDISLAGTEASEAVETAMAFAKDFRQRFKQGTVGKLTGMAREGGRRISEGLTLEQSIGATGPKGRQAMDDILTALDSGSATFTGAASDYIKSRFLRDAVTSGQINLASARRFLTTHDELLTRLPELRQQFEQSIQAGRVSGALSQVANPKKSKAALFIQKGPDEAFREIGKLTPDKAAREAQKLVNMAARDQSGEAAAGLKSGFTEFLMKPTGSRDISGRPLMSGFDMKDAIDNPSTRAAMRRIFSAEEIGRLNIIARDLIRIEKATAARGSQEGVLGDELSSVLNTLVRLAGAASGRQTAAKMGLGGTVQIPGIMSNRFLKMAESGIQNPARQVIEDSVQDERLLREFLMADIKNGQLSESAIRQFSRWAASVLAGRATLTAARTQIEDNEGRFQ